METIILTDVRGFACKSGIDQHGNVWTQFEVDRSPGECSICGAILEFGWMCMDGGEEICDTHIEFKQ